MTLKFVIHEPKAKLLFSPNEFFNTLNNIFRNSQNRIVISCLYMGNGELEKELIESIKKNKNIKNIRVDILLDKQRGTRPEGKLKESSISLLSELFNYCNNININLFHNPLLGAMLYNILPYRINETIGVMHMKGFIGDDILILSGANLSDQYLRNRQDRYLLIENKLLADSVHKIINTIQKMSFTLNVDLTLKWKNDLINPLIEAHLFREQYYRRIQYMIKEIQNDISDYNKKYLNTEYNDIYINSNNSKNMKNNNIQYNNTKMNDDGDDGDDVNDKRNYDNINKTKNYENQLYANEICKTKNGKIHNYLNQLKHNIYNDKNKKKIKDNYEKNNESNSYLDKKNDFFYPLLEKNKSVLVIELAIQSGFSIPPIYDESEMLENLLKNIKNNDQSIVIASGYLNFPQNFLKLFRNIFDNLIFKKGKLQLITASPYANSFYKSKGLSHYVPSAYSSTAHLCIEFITKNVSNIFKKENENNELHEQKNCYNHIYLEYCKPSWTFHSKGIWIINNAPEQNSTNSENSCENYVNDIDNCNHSTKKMSISENYNKEKGKCVQNKENEELNKITNNNYLNECFYELPWSTVIGSSNFGYRSTYRDLEMSFIIKTNDYNLRCQLQKELNIIYESSNFVHMDELKLRFPNWLKLLVKYIMKWFL